MTMRKPIFTAAAVSLLMAGSVSPVIADEHAAGDLGTQVEALQKGQDDIAPSFVVGIIDDKDPSKVKGLKFIRGAVPFAQFKAALDEALASPN